MKKINRLILLYGGGPVFWWFIGGMFIGSLLTLFFLAILNACIKENIDNEKERREQ